MRILTSRWGKIILAASAASFVVFFLVLSYLYVSYSRTIDEKLKSGPFPNTALLYAAPRGIQVGDELTPGETATLLRKAGYSEGRTNPIGWYMLRPGAIEIHPESDSYFKQEGAVIKFAGDKVTQIVALRDNVDVNQYQLEPELITSLFDQKREKRRIVQYDDLPPLMVQAILSAEDKRFFDHAGFDPLRIAGAIFYDIKKGSARQGASTLTMQVARTLWLTNKRTWDRKFAEALITIHLEQKLTKKEIFQYYANSIYLGQHGSFSIHGFGEAAQSYFGKEIGSLSLAETALLAGLPQVPIDPNRFPDRAKQRRNLVLRMMKENGFINQQQLDDAAASPVRVISKEGESSSEASYFVDLVSDQLTAKLGGEYMGKPYKIYTTLDIELQQDANAAVKKAMVEVDKALASRFKGYPNEKYPLVQVALVALDPHTGEVRALLGGRDYGQTQLNRAISKRQPGSSFKPFVYAAALSTVLQGDSKAVTPVSTYVDEPTTFWYDGKPYEPGNFHDAYYGTVTLRQALSKSMNIPTVKIAEEIGYRRVVQLARNAGMNADIRATPAVALGAYEVTPLEVAGAYTIFSNYGKFSPPGFFIDVRDPDGERTDMSKQGHFVLDSRVAYMMTNLMQEVTRSGTGAGIRSRGFWQPAAGKTGSSRDGWFVGYTSKLLCAVWIGFDDNKDIGLEGARTALPVWAEFMKRAHSHRQYRAVSEFAAPDGVLTVEIDPLTGLLATSGCQQHRPEVFIAGTQPIDVCKLHGGGSSNQIATWEAAPAPSPAVPTPDPGPAGPVAANPQSPDASPAPGALKREVRQAKSIPVNPAPQPPRSPQPSSPPQQKGLMDRIRGIFK